MNYAERVSVSSLPLPTMPNRAVDAHKGSMGRVLLIAGSKGMAGAATLAAESSLRMGVGYAFVLAPGAIAPELTAATPSAVLKLCGDSFRQALLEGDWSQGIVDDCKAQSIVLGPGLGRDPSTIKLVKQVVESSKLPCVIDADALHPELPYPLSDKFVLTPHQGEANRLLGEVIGDRELCCQRLVEKYKCVVLLKGAGTLIANQEVMVQNQTGNAGMATAGSGDVLSGCIGALLARGMSSFAAAHLGAHIHGLAGDLAMQTMGEDAVISPDLISYLPSAIQGVNK